MKNILSIALVSLFSLGFSSGAFASHHEMMMMDDKAELSKEQREALAKNHDKMAQCLRSEKTLKECHQEMMDACEKSGDGMNCPMKKMKNHKMMKNSKMMNKDSKEESTPEKK